LWSEKTQKAINIWYRRSATYILEAFDPRN